MLNNDEYSPKYKTLVIIPMITANAYKPGGFYDFYSNQCDERCLTIQLSQSQKLGEAGSESTWRTLERVGYTGMNDFIVDYFLRTNPKFLDSYHTVIVLHNEYVTQRLFDALEAHPNVVYLAPNANYGLVDIDKFQVTLLAGHSYKGKWNAFGWKYDNTDLEYNKACKDFGFKRISNGYQLDCNPEITIHNNFLLLKQLREL